MNRARPSAKAGNRDVRQHFFGRIRRVVGDPVRQDLLAVAGRPRAGEPDVAFLRRRHVPQHPGGLQSFHGLQFLRRGARQADDRLALFEHAVHQAEQLGSVRGADGLPRRFPRGPGRPRASVSRTVRHNASIERSGPSGNAFSQ